MIGVACGFCTGRTRKKIFLKKSHQLKIFFSSSPASSRLRQADPSLARSSLNSTCGIRPHSGFKGYRLYAETPLSLLGMRDAVVPLTYGVPPSRYRLRRLRLRFPAPRYRNSASVHSSSLIPRRSRHVFRPRCLSSASIQNLLQETRPRQLLQNFAIGSRYKDSISASIPLFG